jgi:hypothetical protein
MFRGDIDPDRLQRTFDRETWLRLAKCREAGTALGREATVKLDELSRRYPEWRTADDERDEFPIWMGGDEDWREFLQTPKTVRELIKWLREHPTRDTLKPDDWRDRCKRDFRRTSVALIHLACRDEWIAERWSEALHVWAEEPLASPSWRCLSDVLPAAAREVVREIAHALGWWLCAIATTFPDQEDRFFDLVHHLIDAHRDQPLKSHDDPVSAAINHPVGQATEAALHWWYRQPLNDGQGLPEVLKSLFTDLCDTQVSSYRHGRVLLARHVIALFRVDGEWATQCLLPLFDWGCSIEEASSAWQGFLWSPRLYPPLMEHTKAQFLAGACYYESLGEAAEQYSAFLTLVALEPSDLFHRSELAVATRSLPAEGLEVAARTLVRALEATDQQQRAENWRNRVAPYLQFIWPKSRDFNTTPISESFARLCLATEDAFPEARRKLRFWLRPLDHPNFIVKRLHDAKLCERFPEDSLEFLEAVVDDKPQLPPRNLKDCLEAISTSLPAVEDREGFQRLRDYQRKYPRT